MKTLKYIAIALGVAGLISSCDSMEDTYKEYLEGGDIVYRAKAKEIVGYSGYNRAKLTWKLEYPFQVVKCQIRENDEILAEIPVNYQDNMALEYVLTDQSEKTHTYSVYSLDSEGNSSIKSDVIVEVYGDRYVHTLRTGRSIQTVLRKSGTPTTALVRLSANASSKVIGTDLLYKSVGGQELKQRVAAGDNEVVLENVATDSYFKLSDIWRPADTAIDEFAAAAKDYAAADIPMPLARTFSMMYKVDATTVEAVLSSANTEEGVNGSVISYAGQEIEVAPSTNKVTLTDVPSDAEISIVTKVTSGEVEYKTTVSKVAANTLVTKIAMADWEVIYFSSQQESGEGAGGGHASHAIDDNLATFWHTQYSPASPTYPHQMTIDMHETATVQAIAVARRNGNSNFAAQMKLEVSSDNINWAVAGEFRPDNSIDGLQMFKLTTPLSGCYVRLTGVSSATSSQYLCLSEMNLYK